MRLSQSMESPTAAIICQVLDVVCILGKSPKVTYKKLRIQVLLYTYVYIYIYILLYMYIYINILYYNIYIYTCIYILCLCHAKLQSFFRLFPRFSTMFPSCFSLDLASCRVATSCLNFSSKAKSLATGWPRNIHKLVELPIENEQKS